MPRSHALLAAASLVALLLPGAPSAQEAKTLRLRVADADGKPVANATVAIIGLPQDWSARPEPGQDLPSGSLASGTTGDDGGASLDVTRVPAGLHALRVDAPGRPAIVLHGERIAFGGAALPGELGLTLPPAASVMGIVLDPSGRPAAGTRIAIAASGPLGATILTTRAGQDGRFSVAGLPSPAEVALLADRPDMSMARVATRLLPGSARRTALHLEEARAIAGTIVTRGSEPKAVAGARIVVVAPHRGGALREMGMRFFGGMRGEGFIASEGATGPDGSFRVTVPPLGQAWLFQPGYPIQALSAGRSSVGSQQPLIGTVVATGSGGGEARPVPGARVRWPDMPVTVTTDAKGAFTLPQQEGEIVVTTPGGATVRTPVRGASARIPVPREHRLQGSVAQAPRDGAVEAMPLAGALVRVALAGDIEALAATDATGRFDFTVPRAPDRLTVAGSGLAASRDREELAPGALRVVAQPASALAVAVTAGGRKAAHALAVIRAAEAPLATRLVRADADGVVSVDGLPPAPVIVAAFVEGFSPEGVRRVPLPAGSSGGTGTGTGASAEPLALEPSARVRVRAVDAQGKPIEGVLVIAAPSDEGRPMMFAGGPGGGRGGFVQAMRQREREGATAGTAADGVAVLDGFTASECVRLTLARPGLAAVDVECARASAAAAPAALDVVMERGATVRGLVLDPEGAPVPFALVGARADSATSPASGGGFRERAMRMFMPIATATADAAGAFVLDGIKPGRVELYASAPGFLDGEPTPADLASGDEVETELRVRVAATVEGTVLTPASRPVEGAMVTAMPSGMMPRFGRRGGPAGQFGGAQTDAEGRFVIEGLEPGTEVAVEARWEGEVSDRRVAVAGKQDAPLALVLRTRGRIEGRVLGAENVDVAAQVVCQGAPAGRGDATADLEGTFEVRGLPAGTYACIAIAGDAGEGRADNLAVKEGETTSATIRLGPRTRQDVLARDAAGGQPLAGATVSSGDSRTTTDAQGRASVALDPRDLASADGARVVVALDGYATSVTTLGTPRPAVLEIRLDRAAILRGVVQDATGPVAGIEVRGGGDAVTADAQGRFEITPRRVMPRVTLTAERTAGGVTQRGSVDVEVGPAGADGIVLRLEAESSGSALVAVSDGAGPVSGAQVALVHEASPMRSDVMAAGMMFGMGEGLGASGMTDGEGTFLAEGLRPGQFTILCGREGENTLRAAGTVRVTSGSMAQASVRIAGGVMVTGRVVRAGTPVEGAMVFAQASSGGDGWRQGGAPLATGGSGADGSFSLGPIPESVTKVVVRAMPMSQDAGDRSAEAPAVPGGAPVVLDVAGSSFTGTVVADGRPVGNAEVEARAQGPGSTRRARTQPDGSFIVTGLDPGASYDISARAPGRAAAAVTAVAPSSGAASLGALALGAGEIAGTVAAAGAGRVGNSFQLALVRASGARVPSVDVPVDAGGAWRTSAPSDERLLYRASSPGLPHVIGALAAGDSLPIVFPAGAELTLQVMGADGRPAPGVTARIASWNDMPADDHLVPSRAPSTRGWMSVTDENGQLVLYPMMPGKTVLALARDGASADVSVTLADGARESVTVTLR